MSLPQRYDVICDLESDIQTEIADIKNDLSIIRKQSPIINTSFCDQVQVLKSQMRMVNSSLDEISPGDSPVKLKVE